MKTTSAKTAKHCKQFLQNKFPDIKFSVTSSNFAGGNSISVKWEDGVDSDLIKPITNAYQYGNFNGMIDMYEMNNRNDSIPQVKYATTSRSFSNEAQELAKRMVSNKFGIDIDTPENTYLENHVNTFGQMIYKVLINSCIQIINGELMIFHNHSPIIMDDESYWVYYSPVGSSGRWYLIDSKDDIGFRKGFHNFNDLYQFFGVGSEPELVEGLKIDTQTEQELA